jgi:hypothetical protein
MQSSEETIPTARKEQILDRIRQRMGRKPAVKMQSMIVESVSSIPLGGYDVVAGKRLRIEVAADEVPGIMSMVERDLAAVEKAKAGVEADILKKLREDNVALGTPLEVEMRGYYPDTWQSKFTKQNDRSPECLVYAECIGEPYFGHPDGLDKVGSIDDERIAGIVAAAVKAVLSGDAGTRALIREQIQEELTAPKTVTRKA